MSFKRQIDYHNLKTRQREIRENFPESLSLRVHRALSWLNRAEQEPEDHDARFIFLWVAFNAAYANEIPDRQHFSERKLFQGFLGRLIDSDSEKLLYELVWDQFPGAIRLLIDNKYIFQPFWDHHNGQITEEAWQLAFQRSKAAASRALGNMNTRKVMGGNVQPPVHLAKSIAAWRCHLEQQRQPQSDFPGCRNHGAGGADSYPPDDE